VVDAVREIAETHGASMAQVALAWVTRRPGVTSTILGTRNVGQLDDNLGAARLELAPEQVARLDEVSDPGLPPYPYGFIEEMSRERAELRGEGGPIRSDETAGRPPAPHTAPVCSSTAWWTGSARQSSSAAL
jgi:hypothetical protein